MRIFAELGALIERRWREHNFDEHIFPDIAADALREADLPSKVSAWDVAAWVLREPVLPEQRDLPGNFGEPPVTLFNSSRFHIDVYFWLQSTTAVHQHGFCGAFQVLLGGSLQSLYSFVEHERINFHCAIGDVHLKSVEWLKIGDVKRILGGGAFIHSLFHLENPSATIVVRTHSLPLGLPQFSYHKPSLALNPFFDDPAFIKKQQFVSMLINARNPNADALIAELLESSDFHTAVELLKFLKPGLTYKGDGVLQHQAIEHKKRFDRYLEAVQKKHGAWAKALPAVFAEQERQLEITRRRSFIVDPHHRYFLALLLNIEGKDRILPLVAERIPGQDPIETVLDWVEELSRTRITGTTDNALGIEDFNDGYVFVLEGMLKDKTPEQIENGVRTEFADGNTSELAGKVSHYYATLKNSPIFRSLWA